jgi:hypothetical protein
MLKGVPSVYGVGMDLGILAAVTALLVVLGGRLYPAVV